MSKPTFDPNLFVDGIDPKSWDELNNDPDKPLLNRALRGTYPIGSTYKPFLALAALETGKRRPEQVIQDNGTFLFGNRVFRDSNKVPLGPVDLHRSIVKSSDIYYYQLANDLGVDAIHDFMKPWGFGQITGIDVEGEQTGILPSIGVEGEALQAEVVSRRDDLGRHRPGLQRVHAAAARARHREPREQRRGDEAAPGEGDRRPAHRRADG